MIGLKKTNFFCLFVLLLLLCMKADIITSLRSRLDIILDEADDGSATNELEQSPSQKVTQVVFHELRYRFLYTLKRIKKYTDSI
jgi:hypothetical protein